MCGVGWEGGGGTGERVNVCMVYFWQCVTCLVEDRSEATRDRGDDPHPVGWAPSTCLTLRGGGVEATIIGCHGYLYSYVYLSLHVCHEALCGTVVVYKGDISFLREKGGREGGGRGEGEERERRGGEGGKEKGKREGEGRRRQAVVSQTVQTMP